jgi:hypothetical protein
MDAVAIDPNATGENIGQRTILPSSFAGSMRNMIQNCQDALAINRYYGGADIFLTATADPNWPEVKDALLPGQKTGSHCPCIPCKDGSLDQGYLQKWYHGMNSCSRLHHRVPKMWSSSYAHDHFLPPGLQAENTRGS